MIGLQKMPTITVISKISKPTKKFITKNKFRRGTYNHGLVRSVKIALSCLFDLVNQTDGKPLFRLIRAVTSVPVGFLLSS